MVEKMNWYLLAFTVLLWLAYIIQGMRLYGRAYKHLKDPNPGTPWTSNLWEADKFTDEGNRLRRVAFRFWMVGGCVLVVYALIVNWLVKA
jgi:hypothetical protein